MLSSDFKINNCNDIVKLIGPALTNQKYFQKIISSRELLYCWDDVINEFRVYPHKIDRIYYINNSPRLVLIARIYDYFGGRKISSDHDDDQIYVNLTVDGDGCSNGYIYIWKDLNNFLREVIWPEECNVISACRLIVYDNGGCTRCNDDDDDEEIFYCDDVD